jgi:uracil-DNA glycosylase family 4
MSLELKNLHQNIIQCNKCSRLREHCKKIGREKRKAFSTDTYWAKPVPGFGDPKAELIIVGLAPAAHGANRTGRIFTGDRSGEWLYRALFKAGFGSQPNSTHAKDGLHLINSYITSVAHCAPPENKPTLTEIKKCEPYLQSEIELFRKAKAWVALGQIAYHSLWKIFETGRTRPAFAHGKIIPLNSTQHLILSYHPSQQNTFTGRLTEKMFDDIWSKARSLLRNS